jgi:hypothetical protein
MGFDMQATLSDMLNAVKDAVAGQWTRSRDCARRALEDEKTFLGRLAEARLAGEIDDGTLAQQVHNERETLAAVFRVCEPFTSRMAQDAAGSALEAFAAAVNRALLGARTAGRRPAAKRRKKLTAAGRRLNARRDTVDFRDLMYVPTLIEVGARLPLDAFRKAGVPVLDQGEEGACTGFGLATVAHYLLRTRDIYPDRKKVSPRMFYAMARRYDEWPGEAYDGSSCRGAIKGWHKHGVCEEALWRHDPRRPDFTLNDRRAADAQHRPLGAYFRVNHKDLVAMHAAISETGVLYASADVHSGWDDVGRSGIIRFDDKVRMLGGHAFAIVAYDEQGFWIQNSWGRDWSNEGFARISYADWLKNGSDVWVARLGVPVELAAREAATTTAFSVSRRAKAYAYDEIRPHVISLGNDGQLRPGGNIGTGPEQVRRIIREELPRISKGWKKRRIVLYAHGGLVSEDAAVQRVSEYRRVMLDAECYPLAFVWHSDFWSTLGNMLREATRLRRPEGVLDAAKDFMLDRLDDALEPIARKLTGKAAWDEMKENAQLATESASGGARLVLDELAALARADPRAEIHVVAHSAGSIFHAPLVRRLTTPKADGGLGLPIVSCTLWAPACTMQLFEQAYLPAIESGAIRQFALYTLTDRAEQDDHCAHIYNKSLLYLVSHAFERHARIPLFRPEGEALLGMAKFAERHDRLKKLIASRRIAWVQAPNDKPDSGTEASTAHEHGAFDDDRATVRSTLLRILGAGAVGKLSPELLSFKAGASRLRGFRAGLDEATRAVAR